jgi:hypothetical protein
MTEFPGTPSWEANGYDLFVSWTWLQKPIFPLTDTNTYADMFWAQVPWFDLPLLLRSSSPPFAWILFWHAWGFLAGLWALFTLASRRAAIANVTVPVGGKNVRLRRVVMGYISLAALILSAAAFLWLWPARCAEIFPPDSKRMVPSMPAPPFVTMDILSWLPHLLVFALLFVLLYGCAALWPISSSGIRASRRTTGGGRLVIGALAFGLLLWIPVPYIWASQWERYWAARETLTIPRISDPDLFYNPIEDRITRWCNEDAARRLAETGTWTPDPNGTDAKAE